MIQSFQNHKPNIHESVFVAENATIIGDVTVEEEASIWFGAILRGDEQPITIKKKTNIQDGVIVHIGAHHPTVIEEGVTIGHGAMIHGCHIGAYSLIGMGAIIMDGAKVGKNCIVGAGTVITKDTQIDDGMMVVGTPARTIRPLTHEEINDMDQSAQYYVDLAKKYK